jgi:hypothetical protein
MAGFDAALLALWFADREPDPRKARRMRMAALLPYAALAVFMWSLAAFCQFGSL